MLITRSNASSLLLVSLPEPELEPGVSVSETSEDDVEGCRTACGCLGAAAALSPCNTSVTCSVCGPGCCCADGVTSLMLSAGPEKLSVSRRKGGVWVPGA